MKQNPITQHETDCAKPFPPEILALYTAKLYWHFAQVLRAEATTETDFRLAKQAGEVGNSLGKVIEMLPHRDKTDAECEHGFRCYEFVQSLFPTL